MKRSNEYGSWHFNLIRFIKYRIDPFNWVRQIKYSLQNFWKYKGLIWNDRDWDWVYLYRMMEFKLREMAALHRKYGICSNTGEIADGLEEAAGCLKRLCEDSYDEEDYMRNHLQAEEDLKRFCKLFEESKGWWD